jgi:hypothetical protein
MTTRVRKREDRWDSVSYWSKRFTLCFEEWVSHGNPSGVAEDAVVRSMPSVPCGVASTSGRLSNAQEVPELL